MRILSGKEVAERIEAEISRMGPPPPVLAIYSIGDDPASAIYVRSKVRKGGSLGAEVLLRSFPADAGAGSVLSSISKDSEDPAIDGIVIERPLPPHMDVDEMYDIIDPLKDLEAQHPENIGLLARGRPRFVPPTPLGAILLMLHYGIDPRGGNVAVLGRSLTVGTPLAIMLSRKANWGDATVSLIHSRSRDMGCMLKDADIVISAVGRPRSIKGEMLKPGAHVVDVGISIDASGELSGDADLASMEGVAASATPTPGGTGTVTVSCMFLNLFRARGLRKGTLSEHEDDIIRMIYG
ncbi:MAG: bifunctional 5,10-methylenetetrahydrofolate dehydrogenase/5,10-methenyltetrahydrofolate cyclohydrolase [Candidatus Thermoplasmatota archaeon]|nr:bifunctional 5,10-methylenetetrahydrofolate dehydrogenase/5,10-methenyltetrahydrofolate cyclohydrolase [Candidatus Thermoplasmatota archaeon]